MENENQSERQFVQASINLPSSKVDMDYSVFKKSRKDKFQLKKAKRDEKILLGYKK
jgi:hypothetical protein